MSKYVTVINGRFVDEKDAQVSVLDHGFLFGDSIYEVVRTVQGKLFGARQHLKRLHASADALGLKLPLMDEQFIDLMREMHRRKPGSESYLRVIVTRGVGELDLHPASCQAPATVAGRELQPRRKSHSGGRAAQPQERHRSGHQERQLPQ